MAELLKNYYNLSLISKIGQSIKAEYPTFDSAAFSGMVFDSSWEKRELKQRMRHITNCMYHHLPKDYTQALQILCNVAPDFRGFAAMLFPDYVEVYGLKYMNESLKALEWFTQFSSSEFAIRPFIIQDTERAMKQMSLWSVHENHHVRRLASEGCRPRLPWAVALPTFKRDPSAIIPILENLKEDTSEYVRRSVANNLNDIAKDNPGIVLDIIKRWKGNNMYTDWIVKHASRSLLKKGVTEALVNFDFHSPRNIFIRSLWISSNPVQIGSDYTFEFELKNENKTSVKLRLEFGVYYVKASGKTSRKIFQIAENNFDPDKTYPFKRKLSFKNLTTRKHYCGIHKLVIVVNGLEMSAMEFELVD